MSSAKRRPFCLGLNVLNNKHVSPQYAWYGPIEIIDALIRKADTYGTRLDDIASLNTCV